MGNATVRALVGARVSNVQGEEKTSHITQRGKGQAYADSQSWCVVGAFEDLDVSAIKLSPWERPDLRGWLNDRPDDWDALIFAKTDRVFRSAADCVKLAEWCREHHKILVLVDDGIKLDYYHPEDTKDAFAGAMSKVFLILASVFAEIEGQRFVQRARDRVAFLRGTDRWGYGIPPFGFLVVDHPQAGKALDFDPEQQTVLHEIVDRFLGGASLTRIAHELSEAGTLSPQDWNRQRGGRPTRGTRWTVDKLKHILSNPTTQGVKTAAGKPVLDAEGVPVRVGPASFDPEVWGRLQAELAARSQDPRRPRHSTNPLLGVAKCGVCGANMRQRSQTTPAGVTHRYYVCGRSPRPCPGVSMIAEDAETVLADAFLDVHADRRMCRREWQPGSDHSVELEQTVATIAALREDRALGLFTTAADQEMYRQQMTTLVGKRDRLLELPVQKAGWVEIETDRTYRDAWPGASLAEKRDMLLGRVQLTVRRPNDWDLLTDLTSPLGEGPSGAEELVTRTTGAANPG